MTRKLGTVLFLSHDASRTGAPIFLLRFLRWLRESRDLRFRMLVGKPGDLISDFEALGTVDSFEATPTLLYKLLRRINLHNVLNLYHRFRLRENLLQSDVRLIYTNSVASAGMLDFLSFLNCPVITHVHELEGVINALGAQNIDVLKMCTSEYIAVSQAVKKNLVECHKISEHKITMIHGFVPTKEDIASMQSARGVIHQELKISEDAKIVCACGSIEPRKGTDLFLQVAERVMLSYIGSPVCFVWIGGEPEVVSGMRKQVESSMLSSVVRFVGHKPESFPYLNVSDIFLLTSREDPFPLVMMEAALCQKPIICFDHSGGASEFVGQDAGFVVPGFDVNRMADRVVELLSSPKVCTQMGVAARKKTLSHHDLNVGAPKIAAIIERALLAPHGQETNAEAIGSRCRGEPAANRC